MENERKPYNHQLPAAIGQLSTSAFLLVVAGVFVTIFSYTTSPLYPWGDTPDSPIFQIVGKYWAEGWIPYKDLWDLKGPFIFLVNALGYGLTGTRFGLYALQILSLFLTLMTVHQTFRLCLTRTRSLLLTLLSLAGLAYVYEGGNLTEEYILFPLSLSFYCLSRWLDAYEKSHTMPHNPWHTIVYGITLGLCLMSRLTNALSLSAAIMVVIMVLLWHRRYQNLLLNALSFLLGFILSTLPFVVYFHQHGALADMWNGTFLFPLEYAGNADMNLLDIGIHYFFLSYFNSLLLIFVAVLMLLKHRCLTIRAALYLFSAAIPFLWFCTGNGYGHYGMTVFPLFALAMTEMHKMKHTLLTYAVALLLLIGAASKVRFMYVMYHWENKEVTDCQAFLHQNPTIDYSSFVAYQCDPSLYLAEDIRPAVPVFALQEMGKDRIPQWTSFVTDLFLTHEPQWILVKRSPDNSQLMIQSLLDTHYQLQMSDSEKHLELYKIAPL